MNRDPEHSRPDAAYDLSRLGLRFEDRKVENEFLDSWLRATLMMRIFWAASGTLMYATYSTMIFFLSAETFADLHWFRFLVVLPAFLCATGLVLRGGRNPSLFNLVFQSIAVLGFGNASYCYALADDQNTLLYLYEMAAIFVCAMLYFPALFRTIATFILIGTAISFVTFWHVWLSAGQGWGAIAVQSSLLMALTLSGLAGAWSKEILIRRNFRGRVLERRNRVRAERLALAADAASEAKSRFVAMVGHEFRTPLNAIMGYSEILQMEQGRNWSQERTAEYMADILNSARNLHRLVENVLSVTSGPDEPLMANMEKIELNSITSRVAGTNLLKADSLGIQLNQVYGADRIEVLGDHWMVAHILEELLSNALKFTPSGGRVDIEVMPRSKGGGYIRVSDDGPGIPEDMQGQVFDAFTQSDSNLSRAYGGLGLGLALVRNMTEAQGGTIRLASKPAHGTSIQVSFKPAPD